jgi:hypothetical protein
VNTVERQAMPGMPDRTVVCCRRDEDDFVLLTDDLDLVHAWGGRAEMLRAGVPARALALAGRSGSARLTDPPTPGPYPWAVTDIQEGDWFIDRARAVEYCASRAEVTEPLVTEFALGSTWWADEGE